MSELIRLVPLDDMEASPKVSALSIEEFLSTPLPPRETMLAPWLPLRGLAMLHAPRGAGKTRSQ